MDLAIIWVEFAICTVMIGFAGPELSRSGDIIAEKTGISQNWIGLVMLATVTSLPELITGVSAVTIAGVPDIAVGGVLGSCVFNLAILIVLDFMHREGTLYYRAQQAHIMTAGFGVVLIGAAGLAILLAGYGFELQIGHIGFYSLVMIALYFISVRTVFSYEKKQHVEFEEKGAEQYGHLTLRQAVRRYLIASAFLIAAGVWLPFVAGDLSDAMGWGQTFVGTLLVAAVTSLPELVVTIAALRIGALNMAIANLLGSNLFNIFVLALDDIADLKGPILSHVSPVHAVSAVSSVIMTGIVIIGLLYRSEKRGLRFFDWISVSLLAMYLLNSYVLYAYG